MCAEGYQISANHLMLTKAGLYVQTCELIAKGDIPIAISKEEDHAFHSLDETIDKVASLQGLVCQARALATKADEAEADGDRALEEADEALDDVRRAEKDVSLNRRRQAASLDQDFRKAGQRLSEVVRETRTMQHALANRNAQRSEREAARLELELRARELGEQLLSRNTETAAVSKKREARRQKLSLELHVLGEREAMALSQLAKKEEAALAMEGSLSDLLVGEAAQELLEDLARSADRAGEARDEAQRRVDRAEEELGGLRAKTWAIVERGLRDRAQEENERLRQAREKEALAERRCADAKAAAAEVRAWLERHGQGHGCEEDLSQPPEYLLRMHGDAAERLLRVEARRRARHRAGGGAVVSEAPDAAQVSAKEAAWGVRAAMRSAPTGAAWRQCLARSASAPGTLGLQGDALCDGTPKERESTADGAPRVRQPRMAAWRPSADAVDVAVDWSWVRGQWESLWKAADGLLLDGGSGGLRVFDGVLEGWSRHVHARLGGVIVDGARCTVSLQRLQAALRSVRGDDGDGDLAMGADFEHGRTMLEEGLELLEPRLVLAASVVAVLQQLRERAGALRGRLSGAAEELEDVAFTARLLAEAGPGGRLAPELLRRQQDARLRAGLLASDASRLFQEARALEAEGSPLSSAEEDVLCDEGSVEEVERLMRVACAALRARAQGQSPQSSPPSRRSSDAGTPVPDPVEPSGLGDAEAAAGVRRASFGRLRRLSRLFEEVDPAPAPSQASPEETSPKETSPEETSPEETSPDEGAGTESLPASPRRDVRFQSRPAVLECFEEDEDQESEEQKEDEEKEDTDGSWTTDEEDEEDEEAAAAAKLRAYSHGSAPRDRAFSKLRADSHDSGPPQERTFSMQMIESSRPRRNSLGMPQRQITAMERQVTEDHAWHRQHSLLSLDADEWEVLAARERRRSSTATVDTVERMAMRVHVVMAATQGKRQPEQERPEHVPGALEPLLRAHAPDDPSKIQIGEPWFEQEVDGSNDIFLFIHV